MKSLNVLPTWTIFILFFLSSVAFSQDDPMDPADSVTTLDSMVVTATRSPMDISRVTANVTVITAEEIENLPVTNVAEVLQYVPGVYVELHGGLGSDGSGVSIQGSTTRQVSVFQDGVPLNQLALPQTDLSYLSVSTIDRIEIYKGAASSAWGSALGGVINIVTKEPDRLTPFTADVQASYGEFQTFKSRASASGTINRFGYLVSGLHEQSDGFMENTDFEHDAAYVKLNYDVGNASRINFATSFDKGSNADPIPIYTDFWDDIDRRRSYQRLLFETAPTDNTLLTLQARHHQHENSIEDVFSDRREIYSDYEDELWGGSAALRWDLSSSNAFVGGFDGDWGEYDWNNYDRTYDTGYWAAYVNDTHTMGNFTMNLGLRYDDNRDFGSAFSPSAGIVWNLLKDGAHVRAQVAKGFSAPPPALVHDPTYGNPDLDPETAVNVELGGDIRLLEQLLLEVNLFHSDVEDMIQYSYDSQRHENINSVTRKGVEWAVAWQSNVGLAFRLAGNHVDVTDDETDETVKNIARHQYNVSAFYSYGWMDHTLVGRYIDHNSSFPETDDKKFVFDYLFKAKLPLERRYGQWQLFFTVYNLFDTDYLYQEVWPKPGRWVEGGVRFVY